MENRDHKREEEEENPEPDREFGQDGRGLRTEQIIGKSASKSSAKTLVLGALHQDREDHEKADDNEETGEEGQQEPHSHGITSAQTVSVKPDRGLTFGDGWTEHDPFKFTFPRMARSTKTSKKPTKAPAKKPAPSAASKQADKDFPEVRSLIELLKQNDLAVLEFEKGDFRITLKTPAGASGGQSVLHTPAVHHAAPTPSVATTPAQDKAPEAPKANYKEITSPMVGTFYAAPSPEAAPFVEAGKSVNPETVVCIIEAMKVMNEIKAEISGKVVEVVAESGKPVQFGQVLFRVS